MQLEPRTDLWCTLEKLGVPETVKLIKSFHEGMKAQVHVSGELMEEEIDVDNGFETGFHNGSNFILVSSSRVTVVESPDTYLKVRGLYLYIMR